MKQGCYICGGKSIAGSRTRQPERFILAGMTQIWLIKTDLY